MLFRSPAATIEIGRLFMKLAVSLVLVVTLLSGCGSKNEPLDRAMELRKQILSAENCTYQTVITADYEDVLYTFQMDCDVDNSGVLQFTVTDPESIQGITGRITDSQSSLTYDDKILAFPLLTEGELTPVSAPWIFISTLRSGYLTGCSKEKDGYCLYIDDSYEEYPLNLTIYTDDTMLPTYAEIIWQSRRILTLDIQNFTIR